MRPLPVALLLACAVAIGAAAAGEPVSRWLLPVDESGRLAVDGKDIPDAVLRRSDAKVYRFDRAPRLYFANCGGCHGVHGISMPTNIPTLRDFVGHFTRFPEGRAYLVRVPGVAGAPISDNADLAAVLNFVVLAFGGASVPADFQPYTAAEVATLRADPLIADLRAYRARLVDRLVREYGVSADADLYAPRPN